MAGMSIQFTSECRRCNPGDPVYYDDKDQRDYEAQQHANRTGHTLSVGFVIK